MTFEDASELAAIDGRVHVVVFPDLKRIARDWAEATREDRERAAEAVEQRRRDNLAKWRARQPGPIVTFG